ncbi:MAG: hypothetical protein IPP97_14285 [Candidatus Obscuribacter sp.]|nr:hypothetical protein [Candidatus Obscuribacter sp.]MBP6349656.1 hypothetical protein [Candidatus Obscuribacter sp.]MBP6592301.1 hypothetical protein [Candidatus Obscuribacter sp.]MBP7576141.1 hypothetical protein [Candidatus Obscuribacter sp.]
MLSIKLLLCAALQVVLFGLSPLSARAIGDPLAPVTINEIKIVGNHLVSTDKIISVMKVRKGDLYSRDRIMDDLKAINRIGCFDDRKLDINPVLTDGGVVLTIKVVENPVIKRFVYKGNTKISDQELDHLFAGQVGLPQNFDLLSKAIDEVEHWYHARGYVLAKVADIKDSPDGTAHIIIDEGKLSAVEVTGVEPFLKSVVIKRINIVRGDVYNKNGLILNMELLGDAGTGKITRSIIADKYGSYILKIQFLKKVQVGQPSGTAHWYGVRGYRSYNSLVESSSGSNIVRGLYKIEFLKSPYLKTPVLSSEQLLRFRAQSWSENARRRFDHSYDDKHPILKTPLFPYPGRSYYETTPIRDFVENPLPVG